MNLPAVRISQHAMETVVNHAERIKPLVRMQSAQLTTHCRQAGMSLELAELCGGLLASVVDDLVAVSRMPKTDFDRTKRKQRILAVAQEPSLSALRCAVAASPLNGRAAVAHWDAICDKWEIGKLAWLMGMDTETSWRYSRRLEKRT